MDMNMIDGQDVQLVKDAPHLQTKVCCITVILIDRIITNSLDHKI